MVLPDDTYPSSHVSELGGGQLTFDLPNDLLSVVLSGHEFLSLAAQHLAVERQESSTSTDPDIWMDDHTLAFLLDPGMDLSMHSDAERKRILRRASSYVMTGKLLYRKMPDEVFPLKDKSSAEIAYHFLHGVIARYGAPAEVLIDGGGEFQAEFDYLLLKCLIDHRVTSPHRPEANGASERFVKTVKIGIARYVESTGSTFEWDLFLP
ncbi:hypothetical protein CEUSTIGMA_g13696.t1 [Chlamydomonas eustigma]|uniref:Integrase catalytic domain-containing protein n=1 Tax=Chlamydomonas eustigma TaxID=1157962 RepID=A0A250XT88_9CHLO|nr:hypothetical protein CEUSTIGMA_g13696.t1 [Chlamydomonas eustigma]|eukprot:GAX86284.1 hypothetical protein CEUSTIGMA_g13696.t1 [Chlamydomonas eustigma]